MPTLGSQPDSFVPIRTATNTAERGEERKEEGQILGVHGGLLLN